MTSLSLEFPAPGDRATNLSPKPLLSVPNTLTSPYGILPLAASSPSFATLESLIDHIASTTAQHILVPTTILACEMLLDTLSNPTSPFTTTHIYALPLEYLASTGPHPLDPSLDPTLLLKTNTNTHLITPVPLPPSTPNVIEHDHTTLRAYIAKSCSTTLDYTRTPPTTTPPHHPPHTKRPPMNTPGVYTGLLRYDVDLTPFVFVFGDDGGRQKILITKNNRAVSGDRVCIQLNPIEEWDTATTPSAAAPSTDAASVLMHESDTTTAPAASTATPTAAVLTIVQRGPLYSSPVIGHFRPTPTDPVTPTGTVTTFRPVNPELPPIHVTLSTPSLYDGVTVTVSVTGWGESMEWPGGRLVGVIGKSGEKEVRTNVILQTFDIKLSTFKPEVLACLPRDDYSIELTPDRTDFRHLPILSIDPPGCKDIDDALHCHLLPNGNHSVGVHIADVTHYVQAGSAIDVEAGRRSTSTYLVDRRLDMLPGLLTTDLCSLKPNVDRYAFSVVWEIEPDGTIIDASFCKSVIHSIAGLTYQQAQQYIDTNETLPGQEGVKQSACSRLNELAKIFRRKRIEMGALTLASPEVKFKMDDHTMNPTDVTSYQLYEANELVEEFMLLANITVAKRILRQYPTLGVLRNHPPPERSAFDELIAKAALRGWRIDPTTSLTLANSLDGCVDTDPELNKLLRIMSTRCMRPAAYFVSGSAPPADWHHFGLASPIYTHFTSPIRRYADVCVHRLLASAIGVEPLADHLGSKSVVGDLCDNMNRRHRNAQLAGRSSVQMHTVMFFKQKGEVTVDAYVTDVREADGVIKVGCFVPRYGIEGNSKLEGVLGPVENFGVVVGGEIVSVWDKVRVKLVVTEEEEKSVMRIVFVEKAAEGVKRKRGESK